MRISLRYASSFRAGQFASWDCDRVDAWRFTWWNSFLDWFHIAISFVLMGFAWFISSTGSFDIGWIKGLKIVAVAVVAHALIGMGKSLTPDRTRITIAMGAADSDTIDTDSDRANCHYCWSRINRYTAVSERKCAEAGNNRSFIWKKDRSGGLDDFFPFAYRSSSYSTFLSEYVIIAIFDIFIG